MGYRRVSQMQIVRTRHLISLKRGWNVSGFKRDVSLLPTEGKIVDFSEGGDGTLTIECEEEYSGSGEGGVI